MKIVVTGATGFIGKNLLKAVANNNNQYICLVRETSNIESLPQAENIEYRKIKFLSGELQRSLFGADVCIHMIGQMGAYGVTKEQFEEVNSSLTKIIVDACEEVQVKQMIYISTPGVVGFGKRLSDETAPYMPRNLYEKTKVMAEKIVIEGCQHVKYTILRPDFVYGPEDTRRIKMYRNIKDKKFVLTTFGYSHLSPTYVMDVVQGINRTVGNRAAYNQIFNISSDRDMTVKEYLNTIAEYFGTKIIQINIGYTMSIILAGGVERFCNIILKKDGFVSKSKIDFLAIDHSTSCEKAKRLLEYHAEYDFRKGFAETMKWCETQQLI